MTNPPSNWYSRGYLPHLNQPGVLQSVTFRLADSLPQTVLHRLEGELESFPPDQMKAERRKRIEQFLDSGIGCCALAHPKIASLVQETLLKWDGDRYRLLAWCIMPNHVHAVLKPEIELSRILQSWKSFTGRYAMTHNTELGLGVPGKRFWMRESWDRYIRDGEHLNSVIRYIEQNPVKAKLCQSPSDWPWSSASHNQ